MNHRQLWLIGAIFGLILVLAACSGSASTNSTSSSGSTSATSSPTSGESTPLSASSSPASETQPTSLANAFKNLQSQNSYIMTAKLTNLEGAFANIPGVSGQSTVKIERAGEDQHLSVTSSDNQTVLEIWRVNGTVWVNLGAGPMKITSGNSAVSDFIDMIGADKEIVNSIDSTGADFQVTGTEIVNGVPTKVETAQYSSSQSSNNMFFSNNENATVDAKIWVAQDGDYLVQGQFTLSGSADATPAAGTTSDGTPSVTGSAEVMISVTKVGQVQAIQPPS